jgi:two-component system, NarL family, sensor kinase
VRAARTADGDGSDAGPAIRPQRCEAGLVVEGAGRRRAGAGPDWLVLTSGRAAGRPVADGRRLLTQVAVAAAVVIVAVALAGAVAARHLAEREAVNDASRRSNLIANAVLSPALDDGLASGDPASFARVDRVVRGQVLGGSIVRVKIWSPDGRVVYSDEPRLVGARFPLGEEEAEVLVRPEIRAEVTDLDRPENQYERGRGKLLEVYRVVRTAPGGHPLLFETYSLYGDVKTRSLELWRGFAGLVVSSLLLLVVLLLPVLWRLLDRVRVAQLHREELLQRAVDASQVERRRIAGNLHDGVVQELAATSFTLAGSVDRARRAGVPELAAQLDDAVGTIRRSIGGLRSLLVDIYPPNLASAGLQVALQDLAGPLRSRGIEVRLELPEDPLGLQPDQERLVFRITHECLVNVVKHAAASCVLVQLERRGDTVVLDVRDDGVGFDAPRVLAGPPTGHLGLRVLADLARDAGATLAVRAAPESGTHWRLTMPVTPAAGPDPPYRQKASGSDSTYRAARSKSWATGSSAR